MKRSRRTRLFIGFALFLFVLIERKYLSPARQKPSRGNAVLLHKVGQPRHLKYVTRHILFERVQIPTVYPELVCKRLLAPDNLHVFQIVQGFKKTLYHFLAVLCLHSSSDFLFASANFTFISLSRVFSRSCHLESVSGLKTGFLPVVKASSN